MVSSSSSLSSPLSPRSRTPRRGQAALEFLSTYGFAMLALLLTLGAISYFGFFDMGSFRSTTCSFPQGLACTDFIIDTADPGTGPAPYLRMNLTNAYGVNITVTVATLTDRLSYQTLPCSPVPPPNWGDGTSAILWCPLPAGTYLPGEFSEGSVRVNFTQQGGTYVHSVAGRYTTRMQ